MMAVLQTYDYFGQIGTAQVVILNIHLICEGPFSGIPSDRGWIRVHSTNSMIVASRLGVLKNERLEWS